VTLAAFAGVGLLAYGTLRARDPGPGRVEKAAVKTTVPGDPQPESPHVKVQSLPDGKAPNSGDSAEDPASSETPGQQERPRKTEGEREEARELEQPRERSEAGVPEPPVDRKSPKQTPFDTAARLVDRCALSGDLAGPGCVETERGAIRSGRTTLCSRHPQLAICGVRWWRSTGGLNITVTARNDGATVERGSITLSAHSDTPLQWEPAQFPQGWQPQTWVPGDRIGFLADPRSHSMTLQDAKTYGAEVYFDQAPWPAGERRVAQFHLNTALHAAPEIFVRCTGDAGDRARELGRRFFSAIGTRADEKDPQGWPARKYRLDAR
jgi:hypothetical protein